MHTHITTYPLTLHPLEDGGKDLREASLGSRLVHNILAGQIDIVATSHSGQHSGSMHFHRARGHDGKKGLHRGRVKRGVTRSYEEYMKAFPNIAFPNILLKSV